jgi:hypothetical protein
LQGDGFVRSQAMTPSSTPAVPGRLLHGDVGLPALGSLVVMGGHCQRRPQGSRSVQIRAGRRERRIGVYRDRVLPEVEAIVLRAILGGQACDRRAGERLSMQLLWRTATPVGPSQTSDSHVCSVTGHCLLLLRTALVPERLQATASGVSCPTCRPCTGWPPSNMSAIYPIAGGKPLRGGVPNRQWARPALRGCGRPRCRLDALGGTRPTPASVRERSNSAYRRQKKASMWDVSLLRSLARTRMLPSASTD